MEIKEEKKEKEGVVPAEEISGSDADRAYDKDGNFDGESRQDTESTGSEGSDADSGE